MLDEVTAGAYGLAAFYLQNALLTTLVVKGHLTMNDAALTARGALHELEQVKPPPLGRELVALARQALKVHAQGWETQAKGN
jgi:hypothetical protein